MPYSNRNLSFRVTVAFILYMAVTLLILTGSLSALLNRLAQTQLNELGNAMGAQLTETLKPHIINNEIISIQVILDNLLADTPVIARATLYSTSNRILAQSQRLTTAKTTLSPYISPVSVDDSMLAQLRLELDKTMVFSEYRLPMWIAISLWLLLSALLAYYLITTAMDYTRRIAKLNGSLGGDSDTTDAEINQLEFALSPFINRNDSAEEDDSLPSSFAMLAISIPNLPKWRAQLNAEHFTGMLRQVDELIENHLALFKGMRIHSRNTAMILQFDDLGGEQPVLRAINCANALLQLTRQLIAEQNIPFEMRITAAYRQPAIVGSPWYNDLEREECIERLIDILPLTGAWELIIDKKDLNDREDLKGCELDDLSAAFVWQFRDYQGQRQQEFHKQLEFLKATLD